MRIVVTGSAGHLGEALVRTLPQEGHEAVGLDVVESPHTDLVGSVADRELVKRAVGGVDVIVHAATLHKPHVGSHRRQQFVDTNITGMLTLLEAAVEAHAVAFSSRARRARSAARSRRRPARPPPGSPRTSRPCRATCTARRRPPPRTCAS
jgi:UDP-glucose 4-epimerase